VWRKRSLQSVFSAAILALPLGIVVYLTMPGFGYDVGNTVSLYIFSASHPISLASIFAGAMADLFFNWSGFLSPLLLLVCLVGTYGLSKQRGFVRNYLLAWITVWCLGSILVAPVGYNPVYPLISESELWRMMYISPLPILLALGIERCIDATKKFDAHDGNQYFSLRQPILLTAMFAAFGAGLFIFWDQTVRIVMVLGTIGAILFLEVRYPKNRVSRILIASFLILLLINAAYRSLYPLLLDPHNLLGTFPTR